MKIITWNVNGIRAAERKGALQALVADESPDFLLLQETKAEREQLSDFLSDNEDYVQHYHSAQKKGYSGSSVWMRRETAKKLSNIEFSTQIPGAPNADEGRVSQLSFKRGKFQFDLLSIYFPNGGKSDEAWKEKLVFYDKTLAYMNAMREDGRIVIVGGDVNVAHNEIDIARPQENDGKVGFHPKERAWVDRLIDQGWSDVWRSRNPDAQEVYSWWTMRGGARGRNVGWRLDYFFMETNQLKRVTDIDYMPDQLGSDHCPLRLVLR
jgi:exodeoxyribonuclease III